ncbi:hypothetical protein M0208_00050 [Sphingomonas sp. SUN019]|uniref:hypothetical protein n=1 Tax=Sphingomonas sp. SUN019 TaxID=2937788 RepID=UPI0021648CC3|nr:hypothetical protein [Sphingomonas sp. SUN019]UVO48993.1 hypothetical protein M0208_00050 [Sphingomonas sp. SUN019]
MDAADGPDETTIDGCVEHLDELSGVSGWAVDMRDPAAPLTIELWAGEELIDSAPTGMPRDDVCNFLRISGAPGYRFDPSVRDRIRDAARRGLRGELVVRIAGRDTSLQSMAARRTLEQVQIGSLDTAPATRDALVDRLSFHANNAVGHLKRSFLPDPGRSIGYVDSIASEDGGLVWVVGWIMDDAVLDRPIVIVDKAAHPAGFAYTLIDRGDLPPGARGFVGVVQSDWRPMPDLPPYFFLTDGSGRFLETLDPTPIRTKRAITPAVRYLLSSATDGYGDLMREMFYTVDNWQVPEDADTVDLVHIDQAAILPGFGAMITGWTLSPNKLSDRFVLKAGARVMAADDRSVSRFGRKDLSHLYRNVDLALGRAGFTAVFRGDLDDARLDEMVLKCRWADGTASNATIPADRVRLLGVTTPIEHALDYYPAIEAELFFADFARHATAVARERFSALAVYEAESVTAAAIFALPATASDLFLIIDNALRHAAALPAGWGIVLAGCPDGIRPLLISLFADLKRVTGRRCSLFLTSPGETNNDIVTGVIDALDLTRFAFISADTLLSDAGWTALGDGADDLVLLEVRDAAAEAGATGTAGLDAFACDAAAWRRIAAAAPPRIGGITLNGAAAGVPPPRIVPDAALALSSRRPSALVARINNVGAATHD